MRLSIAYGLEHAEIDLLAARQVPAHRGPPAPALADPAGAVAEALEKPVGFPALRRALTPDDHIAVVVDESLPRLADLLTAVLDHVRRAGVGVSAVTVVRAAHAASPAWRDELPAAYRDVAVEDHDAGDRRRLSYLATTRKGRRVYLNRTVVDADQLVVLTRRGYDPLLGYSGAEGSIYPALSDATTRREVGAGMTNTVPGDKPWPVRREAAEIAWLLGAPFMIQVVEGAGDEIIHVIGGPFESGAEGLRLLGARWRVRVDEPADAVIATVSGDPVRHGFGELARALAGAARVVKPGGRITLLTRADPPLGPGADLLRQSDEPGRALALLPEHAPPDSAAAFQWASAAQHASIYLLSRLPAETVEELFATPLESAGQVSRIVPGDGSYLVLPDAHKSLAFVGPPADGVP
jgi:hypothetical protein